MRRRAMILDTFAYNKSVKMHPKSTLREALEQTWTALGPNIKNKIRQKNKKSHNPNLKRGIILLITLCIL